MSHTITTGEFEGPLGVLLELVEHGNLEVTTISVAEITTDYLAYIKTLDNHSPEQVSDFAQLGARLLFIKSLALLPSETNEESSQELRQLNLELEEYRRLQQASRELSRRYHLQTWERPLAPRLTPAELPLPTLTLNQLTTAFTEALKRFEPAPATQTIQEHISLDTKLAQLRDQLGSGFTLQAILDLCQTRLEIVVTFLALLELIHEGSAQVNQASQFSSIQVQAAA